MGENQAPSVADIAAVVDNNRGYAYPVFPYGGNGGFGGSGYGSDWIWIILLLALFGGFNGSGNGFGNGFGNDYAWLSNGQKDIMTNTNNGFNTLHLSDQVEGVRDGIYGLSNQLCNCCADMNQTVSNGFYNAEIGANNRQMANMQQSFNNQIATLQGFNNLSSDLASCCCENRLATCQTQNIVQNEANATRFADANNTRDIITNATQNTQAILDKLCQLELDGVKAQVEAKNDKINDLQRELSMADLRASQTAQNAFISQGFANEVDQLYNRLNTCNQNQGCGCGCGNNNLF